jgi:hypothetical protein
MDLKVIIAMTNITIVTSAEVTKESVPLALRHIMRNMTATLAKPMTSFVMRTMASLVIKE